MQERWVKVTHRPINPEYLAKVSRFDNREQADNFVETLPPTVDSTVEEVVIDVPDPIAKWIKDELSDKSMQFAKMEYREQCEEINMCFCRMKCALEDFHDSRYAF